MGAYKKENILKSTYRKERDYQTAQNPQKTTTA
jgi:hypothetical protein